LFSFVSVVSDVSASFTWKANRRRRWAVKGGEAVTGDPERQRRTLEGTPAVAHPRYSATAVVP